ncbi:MAG: 2-oxo acid dehydrogenase subunit E2, partial [Planctomycetes bacterium]|nr:2-oxo acid dehydrogenase subunit E2 [Planctomycetota bacterium]
MIHTISFVPDDLHALSPRAVLAEWVAQHDAFVSPGDILFTYEVDKAVAEFVSPAKGWLRRQVLASGQRIRLGQAVALLTDKQDEMLPPRDVRDTDQAPGLEEFDWTEIDNLPVEPEMPGLMRRIIAERMTMSKRHIPCFYLTVKVDMSGCVALRGQMRKTGIKATYNDMAIKAAALALVANPKVAAIYHPRGIAARFDLHIGFAAALPDDGLVVPVIKFAYTKPLADIAEETLAIAAKAKIGLLAPEDCRGG